MIRARAQIRSGPRKQAFLNHALNDVVQLQVTVGGSRRRRLEDPIVAFREAKGDYDLMPAHVTRDERNLNHAEIPSTAPVATVDGI
jgi:hypothetical protein